MRTELIKTIEFIAKAKEKNGDKYDYSETEYVNSRQKIIVICPSHGKFLVTPNNHLSKNSGCKKCIVRKSNYKTGLPAFNRSTTEQFVKKSIGKHGNNRYGYEKVVYKTAREKVIITCRLHGDFEQTPNNHLNKNKNKGGCQLCNSERRSELLLYTNDVFIKKAKLKQGNKYNYGNCNYIDSKTKVLITCLIHGDFSQFPTNHLKGTGCPYCAIIKNADALRSNTQEFINRSTAKHGDKYNYGKVDYKGKDENVLITCPKHGDFSQRPGSHLSGNGCPSCKESKGEIAIRKYLNENNFEFIKQKKFESCKNKFCLPFDFAIIQKNKLKLIEFHGEQHYKPMGFGGNKEERFKRGLINDEIKSNWCTKNNIPLLIIPFNKIKEIDGILNEFLKD